MQKFLGGLAAVRYRPPRYSNSIPDCVGHRSTPRTRALFGQSRPGLLCDAGGSALGAGALAQGLLTTATGHFLVYGAPLITSMACAELCGGMSVAPSTVGAEEGLSASAIADSSATQLTLPLSKYPENAGFFGGSHLEVAQQGQVFSRIGSDLGRFVAPPGTSVAQRGLPSGTPAAETLWRVRNPFLLQSGISTYWKGASGGGVQYLLPNSVQWLFRNGYIEQVTEATK